MSRRKVDRRRWDSTSVDRRQWIAETSGGPKIGPGNYWHTPPPIFNVDVTDMKEGWKENRRRNPK